MGFFDKILGNFFGNKHEKDVKNIQPLVEEINAIYEGLSALSNDALRQKTEEFRQKVKTGLQDVDAEIAELKKSIEDDPDMDLHQKEDLYRAIDKLVKERDKQIETSLQAILPEAFAVVKETARRFKENETLEVSATEHDRNLAVYRNNIIIQGDKAIYKNEWDAAGKPVKWDMVHYDVQLVGGIVLHQGKIAEMKTGEGKTLVATLPVYLNALAGEGVHIVTVNDYLAKRDSEWNSGLFHFLGLTIDCIDKHRPNSTERQLAYKADITYGTNNEFGFDYLRDNMVNNPGDMVQRKHHFAIVDETDSVLIDDARTPLIISGPVDTGDEKQFYDLKPRIVKLFNAQQKVVNDFLTQAKKLIAEGKTSEKENEGGMAILRAHRGMPRNKALIKYMSEAGVKQILTSAESYYMQNNNEKMPVVDHELYFVIDEKNNSIDLTEKGIALITDSGEDAHFFVIPDVGLQIAQIENQGLNPEEKLARKDVLMQDFAIKSERLHSVQQLLKAYALFEKDVEYVVMEGKVKIVDENTGRIMDGRRYSDGLHQAIEAKENVKVEAASQTWATVTLQNYFRMYHKLAGMTGTAETEAGEFWDIYKLDVVAIPTHREVIRDDREDLVYKTKREKYNAIIDEVVRLQAEKRPVLLGTTSVEVSELLSRMLNLRKIKHNVLNAKQHAREADIVAEAGTAGTITIATNMAGRGTDIKLTPEVVKAGGLAIVGSERHDSRRIDRQLRGRAGRQGDPGSSQFFVSMEDDLMRLFGSDRMIKIMDTFGYKEGEVIQHSMITKNIERAQRKVEENNFGIRKRLLEYDDVMNNQRNAIYEKRRHALFGERLSLDVLHMFSELCDEIIANNKEADDFDNFKLDVIRYMGFDTSLDEPFFRAEKQETLSDKLLDEALDAYKRRGETLGKNVMPVLNRIYADKGESIKNVIVPYATIKGEIRFLVDLKKAVDSKGRTVAGDLEKSVCLSLIDDAWRDHLRAMDDLKQEVQFSHIEQKDPLLIYKLEAYNMFKNMLSEFNRDIVGYLMKGGMPVQQNTAEVREAQQQKSDLSKLKTQKDDMDDMMERARKQQAAANNQQQEVMQGVSEKAKPEPIKVGPKVGRNDPCPCGSGKKYKNCHGAAE